MKRLIILFSILFIPFVINLLSIKLIIQINPIYPVFLLKFKNVHVISVYLI